MMKLITSIILLLSINLAMAQRNDQPRNWQNTWSSSYIKAKPGQRDNLKTFLIKNWFAMDSIGVKRGLFNDYRLLENTDQTDTAAWHYIVAVEYYTTGTYTDIQDEWQEIRQGHQKVLIDGLDFPQLGNIIKSEKLTEAEVMGLANCQGSKFDILLPYLGQWHEYLVENEEERLYGNLSIRLQPGTCALKKKFNMLTSDFSYETLGYYDPTKDVWIETFTFSNGDFSIYEWQPESNEVMMKLTSSAFKSDVLTKNRWTQVLHDTFMIITESSNDQGKTWQVSSTTKMKRIGN